MGKYEKLKGARREGGVFMTLRDFAFASLVGAVVFVVSLFLRFCCQ